MTHGHSDSSYSRKFRARCREAVGPWPFITKRIFVTEDGQLRFWRSRLERKGLFRRTPAEQFDLLREAWRSLWMPDHLNWWIGILFAIGASLFILASLLSLTPDLASELSLSQAGVNAIFFAGSMPFTTAAYLQLYQAANASEADVEGVRPRRQTSLFGWRPQDVGWLSAAIQFIGTILFNFNTFDAMIPDLNWFQLDLFVWAPNILGSILFYVSGHLAYIEVCNAHWGIQIRNISWWIVFINLLGCFAFLVSAILGPALPGPEHPQMIEASVTFTLLGAVGFLIGSLLMLPEATCHAPN